MAARDAWRSGIEVWWGGRDRVVAPAELDTLGPAAGARWPERRFPAWVHYPMLDDPEGWVRAVAATVARTAPVMIDR
jgi:pimeloyl-ACP methyl ester carboxylesterase